MIKYKWEIMNKLGKLGKKVKCYYVMHKGGTSFKLICSGKWYIKKWKGEMRRKGELEELMERREKVAPATSETDIFAIGEEEAEDWTVWNWTDGGLFTSIGVGTIEALRRVPHLNLTLWGTLWSVPHLIWPVTLNFSIVVARMLLFGHITKVHVTQ